MFQQLKLFLLLALMGKIGSSLAGERAKSSSTIFVQQQHEHTLV